MKLRGSGRCSTGIAAMPTLPRRPDPDEDHRSVGREADSMLWWFGQTTMVASGLAAPGGPGLPLSSDRARGPPCALAGHPAEAGDASVRGLALAPARRVARPHPRNQH